MTTFKLTKKGKSNNLKTGTEVTLSAKGIQDPVLKNFVSELDETKTYSIIPNDIAFTAFEVLKTYAIPKVEILEKIDVLITKHYITSIFILEDDHNNQYYKDIIANRMDVLGIK